VGLSMGKFARGGIKEGGAGKSGEVSADFRPLRGRPKWLGKTVKKVTDRKRENSELLTPSPKLRNKEGTWGSSQIRRENRQEKTERADLEGGHRRRLSRLVGRRLDKGVGKQKGRPGVEAHDPVS